MNETQFTRYTTSWLRAVPAVGLVLLALLCVQDSSAQRKYTFEHLTVKHGLSQGSVLCILQDSKGFMWFGTQDGLNRYDGYHVKVFKNIPGDSTSLNGSYILTIAEDSNQTLWIRTNEGGTILNRFDRATESFTQVPGDSVNLLHAQKNVSRQEYDEPSGVQWRGTARGSGLTRFDPRNGTTTVFKHDPSDPHSLIDNRIYYIYGDRGGTIWVGTRIGLDRFNDETGTFTHYTHQPNNPNSLSDSWVWPIFEDKAGILWVGTYNGGLNRFDRKTGTFTRYLHEEANPRSLNGNQLLSINQDRSGMIWVGIDGQGVDRFHPDLGAFNNFMNDPKNPASLLNNNVVGLYVDQSGVPWIGSKAGLSRLNRRTGKFDHFRPDAARPSSLGGNMPHVFLEDKTGEMWIGLIGGGIDRFDRKRGTFTHYKHNPSNPKSLSGNEVYALYEDRSGVIWAGTFNTGLDRFDRATGTFTNYHHVDSIPGSLGGGGVFALLEDRAGDFWVGTFGGGLDRFDRERGVFTHFKHDDADSSSLSNDLIACLYEDRAGTLWIGTAGGLNRMDRAAGTFRSYHVKDGLPDDVVLGILEDSGGILWLSTNKGLSKFDPRMETFRNFDYNDGLPGDEFNQGAYALDPRSGEMFFGGTNGFTLFHPDSIFDNTYVPPVAFSSFVRYNTDDEEGKPIEERGIEARPLITLTYKDNVASLSFSAFSFYNNFKNQYAYKLEGFSDNWIQLGTEPRATFTNLDAGEYVLRVKGSNSEGVWNTEGASLNLVVTPPWWETRWAYAIYAFLGFSLLFFVRRVEINRREQKAKIRESELQRKAMEAEKRTLEAENERKSKELEEARQLQLSMLPAKLPEHPHLQIAVHMQTATEVGGDYYDFNEEANGVLHVAFGDATGHGMQAGTIVALMKGMFVSDATRLDLKEFMSHCTRSFKGIRLGRLLMALSVLKIQDRKVSFTSGGMPPAYIYRSQDSRIEEILLKGMPLGAMKNFPYAVEEHHLNPGDVILLLSDGLPEQKNAGGEMFGYDRVEEGLRQVARRSPEEIVQYFLAAGETWMDGVAQDDDITLMVIKMK